MKGDVARRPWPKVLLETRGLEQLADFLIQLHDAMKDFVPPERARWCVPDLVWKPGQTICHGDLGPWNTVWEGDRLTGVIDWDLAHPGNPLDDVAQVAWQTIPLQPALWARAGFDTEPDVRARLHTFCGAYGVDPHAVLDAVLALQARWTAWINEFGVSGIAPWDLFKERGDVEDIAAESAWLQGEMKRLA